MQIESFSRNMVWQNSSNVFVHLVAAAQQLHHQELHQHLKQTGEWAQLQYQSDSQYFLVYLQQHLYHQTPQLEHQTDRSSGRTAPATRKSVFDDGVTAGVWLVRLVRRSARTTAENNRFAFLATKHPDQKWWTTSGSVSSNAGTSLNISFVGILYVYSEVIWASRRQTVEWSSQSQGL